MVKVSGTILQHNSTMFSSIDLTGPFDEVEIEEREDGKVLWVNVDGICILRLSKLDPEKTIIKLLYQNS